MADTIQTLSLFSGVGMLDAAVGFALERRGCEHRVAAYCEWESAAASTLIARMEEQSLEPSPVFCGDLRDFPAESFAGRIDGITAGYPCQPYSLAGSQRGLEDSRALGECGTGPIHQMLRIIAIVEPSFVFLENVSAAFKHFRPIGQRLEKIGYAIAPPLFIAAEDVGASHRRERMFVLAYRDGDRFDRIRESRARESGDDANDGREELADADNHGGRRQRSKVGSAPERAEAFGAGSHMADAERGDARQPVPGEPGQARAASTAASETMGEPDSKREQQPDDERSAVARKDARTGSGGAGSKLGDSNGSRRREQIFAPRPGDFDAWGATLADSPHLAPAVEPGFRVLAPRMAMDVDASRADQLRCTGNGVVALQGAVAFEHLIGLTTE